MKLLILGLLLLLSAGFAQERSNWIAYITPLGQLAIMQADGSNQLILSGDAERLQFPAWSPDGNKLAAIGADANGGFVRIYDEALKATEVYRSSQQPPFYLYWSPDSSKLGFLANHPTGIALHVASETQDAYLLMTGAPYYWDWFNNSDDIFIHSGFTGPTARLGFSSTREASFIDNLAPPGRFQSPGISHDERFLAYAELHPTRGPQVVVESRRDLDSEPSRREVQHRGLAALSWSPSANLLAIMSPEQDSPHFYGSLRLLDAETGLLETLSRNLSIAYFWSPDGRYLAYLSPAGQSSPSIGDSNLQTIQQRDTLALELYIIDLNTGSEDLLSIFIPSPLFLAQFLPFFDQYALSHRIWSPTSDALALPILSPAGQPTISIFTLDGTVATLPEGDTPFWNQR